MRPLVSVSVLLALVGCGSGGADSPDTEPAPASVATAQPTAQQPSAAPVQAPIVAPVASPAPVAVPVPVNAPTRAPVASPVPVSQPNNRRINVDTPTQTPVLQQPVSPTIPESVQPVPVEVPVSTAPATIPGSLLTYILARRYDRNNGTLLDQAGEARSEQVTYNNPAVMGQYDHYSYINNKQTLWVHVDRSRIINDWTLDRVVLDGVGRLNGPAFTYNDNNQVFMGTLATWTADGNSPWSVALSIDNDPKGYRLCWTFNQPASVRVSCGLFDTQGEHSGIDVVDGTVQYRN